MYLLNKEEIIVVQEILVLFMGILDNICIIYNYPKPNFENKSFWIIMLAKLIIFITMIPSLK